jgi:hypothetical protein
MARNDLVLALARAGNAGDRRGARVATEAIIAEERAKQHEVLAEKLSKTMHMNGNGANPVSGSPDTSSRGRDYIMEITPRRKLEDMILSSASRGAVDQLIEEQQRADLLRAHGMEPRHRTMRGRRRASCSSTNSTRSARSAAMFMRRARSSVLSVRC